MQGNGLWQYPGVCAMKPYSALKVGLFFSLSPVLGGVVMYAITLFMDDIGPLIEKDIWSGALFCFAYLCLFVFFSIVCEIVPASVLAMICIIFCPKKNIFSYVVLFLLGGAMAFFWTGMIFSFFDIYFSPLRDPFANDLMKNFPAKSFILGGVCSLFASIFSLPKKNEVFDPSWVRIFFWALRIDRGKNDCTYKQFWKL